MRFFLEIIDNKKIEESEGHMMMYTSLHVNRYLIRTYSGLGS
jgi:hypothetical protein